MTELLAWIASLRASVEGVTLSGGEPLQQWKSLVALLTGIRDMDLSTILFTGYSFPEIVAMQRLEQLQSSVDVLIAGRYRAAVRVASGLIGSANKTVHFFTPRYDARDLAGVPDAEVLIDANGNIALTGIDPVRVH